MTILIPTWVQSRAVQQVSDHRASTPQTILAWHNCQPQSSCLFGEKSLGEPCRKLLCSSFPSIGDLGPSLIFSSHSSAIQYLLGQLLRLYYHLNNLDASINRMQSTRMRLYAGSRHSPDNTTLHIPWGCGEKVQPRFKVRKHVVGTKAVCCSGI